MIDPNLTHLRSDFTDRTSTQLFSKEVLTQLLADKGYDVIAQYDTGLKASFSGEQEISTVLDAISNNLNRHGVLNVIEECPEIYAHGHQRPVVTIVPSTEKVTSHLNRVAAWAEKKMPDAKIFFDPAGKTYTYASAAAFMGGICLPLSLALNPSNLLHPRDPSLGHELIHFKIYAAFMAGVPTVFMSDFFSRDGALNQDGVSEFLPHRYNLSHALSGVKQIKSKFEVGSLESFYAQQAAICEVLYLRDYSKKLKTRLGTLAHAICDPHSSATVTRETYNEGAIFSFFVKPEESKKFSTCIPRAKAKEARSLVYRCIERLHTLSSAIVRTSDDFIEHLELEGKNSLLKNFSNSADFEKDRGELIPSLLDYGTRILKIFRQDDFTLEHLDYEMDPIFVKIYESLKK